MSRKKIIRVTTVPTSLKILLRGQLKYMSQFFDIIAVASKGKDLESVNHSENVNTHSLNMTRAITPFRDFIALLKMYFFLKKEKPYIVHSHTPKAGLIGMLGAYFARVPNRLHTIAGLPLMEATGLKRKILVIVERIVCKLATKVYSNSYGLLDFMIGEDLCNKNKIKVIANGSSNGIDTSFFKETTEILQISAKKKKELSIKDNSFVYCFVGRIVKDKGINELVKVFNNLIRDTENAILLLVGDFEEELNSINEDIRKNIMENNNIKFTGFQNDIRPYLSMADVFVFPSYREGLPNVVLQAGCFNLPSIVSDINGNNEIISDKHNGLLIRSKCEDELFEAMLKLYSDNELRKKLASIARNEIIKKYEQRYVWSELLNEYQLL